MKPYFATCVAGAEEIIAARLRRFPKGQLTVQEITDGLVIFTASLSPNQLAELRFFNNVYDTLPEGTLPQLVAGTRVQLRARQGSQPSELPADIVEHLRAAGFEIVAHKPQAELLHWRRTDGRVLWGQALPRPGFKTRKLEQGELRPQLAHILGLVASVDPKDTVLDPFAGYGAIPREMLQGFHCQRVIAVEHNERLLPHLKSIPGLVALHGNAGELAHIESRSIDRVVTDPPWGDFTAMTGDELHHLYRGAVIQMHRVLRAKGCAVILTSVDFLPQLAQEIGFTVEKQYPMLISGNKATIYRIRKLV